jgi:hypothetical protein
MISKTVAKAAGFFPRTHLDLLAFPTDPLAIFGDFWQN